MKLRRLSVFAVGILVLVTGYLNRDRFGVRSELAKKKEHCMQLSGVEKRECFSSLFSEMGLRKEGNESYFNYDISAGTVQSLVMTEENNFKKTTRSYIKNLAPDVETCAYNGFAFDLDKESIFLSSEQSPKVVICFLHSGAASNVVFSESFGILNVYKLLAANSPEPKKSQE